MTWMLGNLGIMLTVHQLESFEVAIHCFSSLRDDRKSTYLQGQHEREEREQDRKTRARTLKLFDARHVPHSLGQAGAIAARWRVSDARLPPEQFRPRLICSKKHRSHRPRPSLPLLVLTNTDDDGRRYEPPHAGQLPETTSEPRSIAACLWVRPLRTTCSPVVGRVLVVPCVHSALEHGGGDQPATSSAYCQETNGTR